MKTKISFLIILAMCSCLLCSCNKNEKASIKLETYDYLYSSTNAFLSTKSAQVKVYNVDSMITLPAYESYELVAKRKVIEDADVDSFIAQILETYTYKELVTEGKVGEGDILTIDLNAKIDGEDIPDASLTDFEYKQGSNLRQELDEKLVDLTIGESYDIPVKVGETFAIPEYANKSLDYTLTIKNKVNYITPALDDEMAVKIAADKAYQGIDGASSLKKYIKDQLQNEADTTYENEAITEGWKWIIDNTTVNMRIESDWEESRVQIVNKFREDFINNRASYDSYEDYLEKKGLTHEEVEQRSREGADRYVKEKMIVIKIAKESDIHITSDEMNDLIAKYAAKYEISSSDEFLNALGASRDKFILERGYEILYNKVRENVLSTLTSK